MLRTKVIIWVAVTLVLIAIGAMYLTSTGFVVSTRGLALANLKDQVPQPLQAMATLVFDNFREYRVNATRWSFVHFGTLFGAAMFSALAGVILKLQSFLKDDARRSDVAAICAVTGALLITLSGLGSFESKWRANRIAAAQMENLAYGLLKSPTQNHVMRRIQEINQERLQGILAKGAND